MSYYRQMKYAGRHTAAAMEAVVRTGKSLSEALVTVDCPMKHRQRLRSYIVGCAALITQLAEMEKEITEHLGKESP